MGNIWIRDLQNLKFFAHVAKMEEIRFLGQPKSSKFSPAALKIGEIWLLGPPKFSKNLKF